MNIFRYARATANGRHSCTPPHSNHRIPATFLLRFAVWALFVRVLIASAALAPQVGGRLHARAEFRAAAAAAQSDQVCGR
jgi:hypothetical protein